MIYDLALNAAIKQAYEGESRNLICETYEVIIDNFNDRIITYGKYKLLPETDENPAGTLFWEFGSYIAEITDHTNDPLYILSTTQLVNVFDKIVKYLKIINRKT